MPFTEILIVLEDKDCENNGDFHILKKYIYIFNNDGPKPKYLANILCFVWSRTCEITEFHGKDEN